MRPDSPALFGEVILPKTAKAVSVKIGCLPSKLAVGKGGNGRWTGYRREFVTAKGVDRLPPDPKPYQVFPRVLGPCEDWLFFSDSLDDGSLADKSKGIGPSFVRFDPDGVGKAETHLSDCYLQDVVFTMKPGAKRFRFMVWGNHGRPATLDAMMRTFKSHPGQFGF